MAARLPGLLNWKGPSLTRITLPFAAQVSLTRALKSSGVSYTERSVLMLTNSFSAFSGCSFSTDLSWWSTSSVYFTSIKWKMTHLTAAFCKSWACFFSRICCWRNSTRGPGSEHRFLARSAKLSGRDSSFSWPRQSAGGRQRDWCSK